MVRDITIKPKRLDNNLNSAHSLAPPSARAPSARVRPAASLTSVAFLVHNSGKNI